jgi:hypothetical protein
MERFSPDSLISDYEFHIADLTLPDPDDRHVLASAIHAEARYVVTYNLSDFPETILRSFNVEAVHPDTFLSVIFESDSDAFLEGIRQHRSSLKNPAKSPDEYIDTLKANHLNELALRVYANRDLI